MLLSHLYRCCEFILVLDGIERLYPPYVLVSVQLLHHSSCVARVSASVLPVLIWMIRTWCPSRFGDLGWQQREANTCHLFSATTNNWRGCQHCRPQDRGSASVPLIWAYLCPIFIYIIYMYYIITHLNISQETRLRLEITQQNLHLRLYRCRIMAPSLMPRPAPLFPLCCSKRHRLGTGWLEPVGTAEYFHLQVVVAHGSDNLLDALAVHSPTRQVAKLVVMLSIVSKHM